MPIASTAIQATADGQYILASGQCAVPAGQRRLRAAPPPPSSLGVYKPRIRCYDVNQLSMKFERCLDAESEFVAPLSLLIKYILPQLSSSTCYPMTTQK